MRITLVHPTHPSGAAEEASSTVNAPALLLYARRLIQLGIEVIWISSTATAEALEDKADLAPAAEDLPATCRHVLSCQSFRLPGLHLFCVDTSVWYEPTLQTRLFTFLCLLHPHLPGSVWQTWADGGSAFLTVYTARFVDCPVVVIYPQQQISPLNPLPPPDFTDLWIGRHTSAAVVPTPAARQQLIATGHIPAAQQPAIYVVNPVSPQADTAMANLYRHLLQSHRP